MSTSVMALCWPLQMPPTQKAVLVSLADNANDHGECWPSIPTIMARTCLGERTVHGAIKWLEQHGALKADRSNGRHTRYVVTPNTYEPPQELRPRSNCAPAADAANPRRSCGTPPQQPQSPPQELRSNRKEPSRTIRATKKGAAAPDGPDGVNPQTWTDWLALRRAKKAPVTETVLKAARAEAAKAGMTLDRFLEVWCARGSQGLEASWLKPHERAGPRGSAEKHGGFEQRDYGQGGDL